jgi:hypothetical protein
MGNPIMLDSRRINSGFFRAGDLTFTVIDGYLNIKPQGFGLQGWFASITINGSAGPLVNTDGKGELEVKDDRGESWWGRCHAEISASSTRLPELKIEGNGIIERVA